MEGIGGILREARERKGATLDQIEETTKIKKRYLLALEHEEWDRMPGKVYAKGFLRTYARYLGLDEHALGDMYELAVRETAKVQANAGPAPAVAPEAPRRRREVDLQNKPKRKSVLILCVVSAVVLYFAQWAYKAYYLADHGDKEPTPPAIILPQPDPLPTEPVVETEPVILTSFTLKMVATENCWFRLKNQGQQIHEATIRAGETLEFPELQEIELRMGNAGGVIISLNDLELPSLGRSGQTMTKFYSIRDGIMYDDETGEAIS